MIDMAVDIAGVTLKNPVMPASGTFGSGRELGEFIDINKLGAVVVKGVSMEPWEGNPPPRIAETYGGMLNAVGLQNPGVRAFLADDVKFLRQYDTKIIVNICGHSIDEYTAVAAALRGADVDFLELNISCPNLSEGGMAFGTNPQTAFQVVKAVKAVASQPLIVKLSPNVTDIIEIAKAAEAGGADAISLINTLLGMKIDIHRRKTVLANRVGGLSGPAIKPVAVRMVWQVSHGVKLPVIGMGGIASAADAIEFIMAGATAVAIGTANFSNPGVTGEIIDGIEEFMREQRVSSLEQIRGVI